jgi:hypothetical protein
MYARTASLRAFRPRTTKSNVAAAGVRIASKKFPRSICLNVQLDSDSFGIDDLTYRVHGPDRAERNNKHMRLLEIRKRQTHDGELTVTLANYRNGTTMN